MTRDRFQKEFYSKPLYELETRKIKATMEELFDYLEQPASEENLKAIKSPETTWVSKSVDMAMNSILHQITVRQNNDRSTLWSRLAVVVKEENLKLHMVDVDRAAIWEHGAENYRSLPDEPEKVKKAYQKARRGKETVYAQGIKRLVEKSSDLRDRAMAIQIENLMDSYTYRDSAVVVGRDHLKGMAKILSGEFKVELYDAGR